MAEILYGKPVADAICENLSRRIGELKDGGIVPTLALLRVGESSADTSYEKGILNKAASLGIRAEVTVFGQETDADTLTEKIKQLNADPNVHGIMLFRPLTGRLKQYERAIVETIAPEKDVDGATLTSLAGVVINNRDGFFPCTPEACIAVFDHYKIEISGRNVVVIGRSAVVGKPLALMLTDRHATVTVCHSKTVGIADICKRADILVASAGKAGLVSEGFVHAKQVLIDVSVNVDPDTGKMCGDATEAAKDIVAAVTPIRGGIGTVTTMMLMSHIVRAAEEHDQRLYD